uniref:Bacteriocin n=1 Tax=Meloidogyne hapla TaxID=6305 RepID=A0A1I8AWZ4_MELHA
MLFTICDSGKLEAIKKVLSKKEVTGGLGLLGGLIGGVVLGRGIEQNQQQTMQQRQVYYGGCYYGCVGYYFPRSDTNKGKSLWNKTKNLFKTKEGKWSKTKIGMASGLAILGAVLLNGNNNVVNTTGYQYQHPMMGGMQPYWNI